LLLQLLTGFAISPFLQLVIQNTLEKGFPVKIRPQHIQKLHLGIGHLPQEKIAYPYLAAGSYHKINRWEIFCIEMIFKKTLVYILFLNLTRFYLAAYLLYGAQDFLLRTVTQSQNQVSALVVFSKIHDVLQLVTYQIRQLFNIANDV